MLMENGSDPSARRPQADKGDWSLRIAGILPFVAIFLVTFVANIAFSLRQGRLANVPTHDDVAYLADGLDRVMFVEPGGLWPALRSVITDPPHAPVSTLTAMLGFWSFGPAPIAAYLANAWVLALYVLVFAILSRPLSSLTTRTLFVAILAFVPVAHAMVNEFRPDMAGGLLFALALGAICTTDFRALTPGRIAAVVALALAATITKLSAVVLTIPALGVAFVATMISQRIFTAPDRLRLARGGLITALIYLVALSPFALLFGPRTLSYIADTLFTDSDIWSTPGSRWFHWTYHAFGPGAVDALGPFGAIALAFILADLVVGWRVPATRRRGARAFYATLLVVYCAMAISSEKTPYQGSYFYLPLLVAAAGAFVHLVAAAKLRWPMTAARAVNAMLGLGLGLSVLFLSLGSSYALRSEDGPEADRLLPVVTDAIFALQKNEWQGSPSCRARTMRITALNYDPLTAGAIQMALAEGGIQVVSDYGYFPRSLAEAKKSVDDVDLVVMVDPATPPTNKWLLVTAMVPDLFQFLSSMPGVRKIQVGVYRGHPFWLFVKPHCDPVTPP